MLAYAVGRPECLGLDSIFACPSTMAVITTTKVCPAFSVTGNVSYATAISPQPF